MRTLQTDVNGFNKRSLQFDGTSEVYTVKALNSGDANSGHIFLERQELVQTLI